MTALSQGMLFEEAQTRLPPRIGPASVSELQTLHLLSPGRGRTGDFDFTLNPYRGCTFACSYCYAPAFEPDLVKRGNWGLWVEAKTRALEALAKVDLFGRSVYMSSVTDPYQPLEAKLKLTRSIVEQLALKGARLVVQTRSPLVARDIDLLQRFRHVRVNFSIPTDSDVIRRRFEPSAPSIERRLATVRQLREAGIKVSVCVSPMLPMDDPAGFGRFLTGLGVEGVTATWFHFANRDFTASTRALGRNIIDRERWTEDGYRECKEAMRRTCPAMGSPGQVFGPV